MTYFKYVFTILIALALFGCASTHHTKILKTDSGLEKFNKVSYNTTDWTDQHLLKPVAKIYSKLPDSVERSFGNAFGNLGEVNTAVNSLLQGKGSQFFNSSGRFIVNSTVGVVGLFEVAQHIGLKKTDREDFGQTLAKWGVGAGPYVFIPFLGPSTLRDVPTRLVDSVFTPLHLVDNAIITNPIRILNVVNKRARLLDIEKAVSGNRYLFIKDAYLQKREYDIMDGKIGEQTDDFDIGF